MCHVFCLVYSPPLSIILRLERKTFKKGIDFESARSRRSNEGIELRRHRRLTQTQRRRQRASIQSTKSGESNSISSNTGGVNSRSSISTDNIGTDSTEKLAMYLSHLNLNISDSVMQLITRGSSSLESLSSSSLPSPLSHGCTATTNTRLDAQSHANLKDVIAQSGIIPLLVQALRSDNLEIRAQSAFCIGNIAGEKAELRDLVLQSDVISPM
jgi:hypothetical protein